MRAETLETLNFAPFAPTAAVCYACLNVKIITSSNCIPREHLFGMISLGLDMN